MSIKPWSITPATRIAIGALTDQAAGYISESAELHNHDYSPGAEIDDLLDRLRDELRQRFDADEFDD